MLNRVITLSPPQKLHLHMYPIISTSFCRRTNRLSIKGENFSKYRKLKVPGSNNPPPPLRGLTGHHVHELLFGSNVEIKLPENWNQLLSVLFQTWHQNMRSDDSPSWHHLVVWSSVATTQGFYLHLLHSQLHSGLL